ncbi:MAG: DUF937 domain-containing protein [Pyrinomonadaceae bacterium]
MFSLEDLLGQQQGNEVVNQMSNNLGANPSAISSAIQMALPMILSGLASNASQPQGADALNQTLQQNHNGDVLNNLGSYIGNPNSDDGLGILGHIFGNKQGAVAQQVSQNSGLNIGQTAQLLITLAPIIMGFLGKKQQDQGLDADGLSSLLQGQQQQMQSSGNPIMDMVSGFLDKNNDGSAMDDLATMASSYMQKRG